MLINASVSDLFVLELGSNVLFPNPAVSASVTLGLLEPRRHTQDQNACQKLRQLITSVLDLAMEKALSTDVKAAGRPRTLTANGTRFVSSGRTCNQNAISCDIQRIRMYISAFLFPFREDSVGGMGNDSESYRSELRTSRSYTEQNGNRDILGRCRKVYRQKWTKNLKCKLMGSSEIRISKTEVTAEENRISVSGEMS
jgi:hypothetical protein